MAQGIFNRVIKERKIEARASSCGLCAQEGAPATPEAVNALAEIDIDIQGHRARSISEELVKTADLIIPMTESHRAVIARMFGCEKLAPAAGISDPFGGDIEIYRRCRDQLLEMCEKLADTI